MWAKQKGFTIVELLIVIVIIAILAAITLVAYGTIQDRARASTVNAALNQAKKKLAIYQVENGSYPVTSNLAAAGISDSSTVTYEYTGATSGYCLTATNGTISYKITESSVASTGGCAGHGQGGSA